MTPKWSRTTTSVAGLVAAAALVSGGCGYFDRLPEPNVVSGAYNGPPIHVDSSGPRHLVVLTAPSGGWVFELEGVRHELDHRRVFVSVTEPDPRFLYTQALIEQNVDTGVEVDTPVVVFARTLSFDQPGSFDFHLATESDTGSGDR